MARVLVIGSGGREHAMAWKIAQSPLVDEVFVAPGNPGMASEKIVCIDTPTMDTERLLKFAITNKIGLTVVGPEDPLAAGIVDTFRDADQMIVGPNKVAAELEASKALAKKLMNKFGVPTAPYRIFNNTTEVRKYLFERLEKVGFLPEAIKAVGLALGKGVEVPKDLLAALEFLSKFDKGNFKGADDQIIIEDCIIDEDTEELSFIGCVDINSFFLPLDTSQDNKRIGQLIREGVGHGDVGPNTGGTGAYSPAPVVSQQLYDQILKEIMHPMVNGLYEQGKVRYTGFLYGGLALPGLNPKVLEFNVRLGDPETQPLLARMMSDFYLLLRAMAEGTLNKYVVKWDPRPAVCVVLMSAGYPGDYEKGHVITGIEEARATGAQVFCGGVQLNNKRQLVNWGGRALSVVGMGDYEGDFAGAQKQAYRAAEIIQFANKYYRDDIGDKALKHVK